MRVRDNTDCCVEWWNSLSEFQKHHQINSNFDADKFYLIQELEYRKESWWENESLFQRKFLADPQGRCARAGDICIKRDLKADGRKVSENSRLRLGKGDLSVAILPAWCEKGEVTVAVAFWSWLG